MGEEGALASKLKITVPEEWERWAEKHVPWENDPERPVYLKDGIRLPIGKYGRLWLPSGHIVPPPIAGGARVFAAGSSQDLRVTSGPPATAVPLTIGMLFRNSDTAISPTLFQLGGLAGNYFAIKPVAGPTTVRAATAVAGEARADTTANWVVNTWHHTAGVFTSATDRAAFLDGGNKGTNATSKTPASITTTSIGAATSGGFYTGDICEVAVWNINLTDADVLAASKFVSPFMVRPEYLSFYVPLFGRFSPEIDVVGGLALTLTNTPTVSDHPRIFNVPNTQTPFIAAAAASNVARLTRGGILTSGGILLHGGGLVGG